MTARSQGSLFPPQTNAFVRAIATAVVLGLLILLANEISHSIDHLAYFCRRHPFWGSVIYIIWFTLGITCLVPGMLMCAAGGAIFGFMQGFILSWLCMGVTGAMLPFVVGRKYFRKSLSRFIRRRLKLWRAINQALARSEDSWKIVALLRLSPIMPWPLISYALAVTAVAWREYLATTAACAIPWVVIFVYMGTAITNIEDLTSVSRRLGL